MDLIDRLQTHSPAIGSHHTGDQLARYVYEKSETCFADGEREREALLAEASLCGTKVLEEYQRRFREVFLKNLGGLPQAAASLAPKITGCVLQPGYRIEKVLYQSREEMYVPALFYIPDGRTKPCPTVLFVCGHAKEAKAWQEYQNVCQHLVKQGLCVFALDPIGQGERFSYCDVPQQEIAWGITEHEYAGMQAMAAGIPSARFFVHDIMRAVDYLYTRNEVDPDKIGITGNSGGGTQTMLMMACDPRIAAAAPATFVSSRREIMYSGQPQDAEQIWPNMTACGIDHADILIAFAPKPLLLLAVQDDFFPIDGTVYTYQSAARAWEQYGKREQISMVIDRSEHHYSDPLARECAAFFARIFQTQPVSGTENAPLEQLQVTETGQVKLDYPKTHTIYDEVVHHLKQGQRPERFKVGLHLKTLAEQGRAACEPYIRTFHAGQVDNLQVDAMLWWSHKGIMNHAYAIRPVEMGQQKLPVTVMMWDGGTKSLQPHWNEICRCCEQGRVCMIVDTTGLGHLAPDDYNGFPNESLWGTLPKLADDLLWLGDSLCAMRIFDIHRFFAILAQFYDVDSTDVQVKVSGKQGLIYRLAKLAYETLPDAQETNVPSYQELVCQRFYDSQNMMDVVIPGVAAWCE